MTVRLGQIMHVNPNYYDEYEKDIVIYQLSFQK